MSESRETGGDNVGVLEPARNYQPFLDACLSNMQDLSSAEICNLGVTTVQVPPLSYAELKVLLHMDETDFHAVHASRKAMMSLIPVLQRADGSLWAYADVATVALYRRFAPTATVRVAVIGSNLA